MELLQSVVGVSLLIITGTNNIKTKCWCWMQSEGESYENGPKLVLL